MAAVASETKVGSPTTIQQYLDSLLVRVPKLLGVFVTDKDGVALVKGTSFLPLCFLAFTLSCSTCYDCIASGDVLRENGFDASSSAFAASFGVATEQVTRHVIPLLDACIIDGIYV